LTDVLCKGVDSSFGSATYGRRRIQLLLARRPANTTFFIGEPDTQTATLGPWSAEVTGGRIISQQIEGILEDPGNRDRLIYGEELGVLVVSRPVIPGLCTGEMALSVRGCGEENF
jgi:hypothetical protein